MPTPSAATSHATQAAYWEAATGRRSPDHPAVQAFARPKVEWIFQALGAPQGWTALEVGAGNGYFSARLDEHFALTALDFSDTMLAQNPLPEARKIRGLAESLPFEDDAFDVVFCGNLLHHLPEPLDAVAEMARVARRRVVLVEPNTLNPFMAAFGLAKREERGTLKFTPAYLRGLARRAGLAERAFRVQGLVLPNRTPAPALPVMSWPLWQRACPLGRRLARKLDLPNPVGFYLLGVFDV